jgi:signal transduction histidine kinase
VCTVLVVDDAPEDAEVVRRHLRRAAGLTADRAYAVRHVQMAAEALAAVRDGPRRPDVVLLDYGLPDMTGIELLDALAAEPGGMPVPVVMLTGTHAHVDVAAAAMRRGALDYLAKDALSADALRRAVDGAIDRFASARLVAAQRDELARLYAAERAARAEAQAARDVAEGARAAADAASRAKSEFLAVMSHELRTPLNAINGYADLMLLGLYGAVSEEQRSALGRIQRSQLHLLGLINEVLNYAKVDAGAVEYATRPVRVAEAVADAEALVAPQLRAKALGYTWSGCDPTLAVLADPDKLQQVLLNLLSNAVKFTNAREALPGRIEASCDRVEDGRVRIQVRDTGIGIPPEKLASVFEPFVQVRSDLTRTAEGTGLGLAISRELARGMGGDLTAESTPGVGSTFTLTLPHA